MTRIDPEALVASLRGLQKASEATGVVHHLERIVRVVDRLFGYAGAGLMFADEGKALRYLVTTDEAGRSLEHAQAAVGRGPCVSAFFNNDAVTTRDVQTDERWPDLAELLHPSVRAVAGVPVRLGGGPVGTLNVYQAEPHDWEESDTQALLAYAHVIEEVLAAAVKAEEKSALADQLQYALDYRIVIERAIGYLMGKHDLTAAQAFTGLRKRARDSRRRVADLAAEILGEQAPPA
ncbi:GAF and ANTAR domain-containing protein [Sphaerisporangium corydalis]|uniref:ANTAR domain-containing protein n=1 Tax=Sphaerisporangium corydalis TaxID=1441875 RepID=A0ABV9EM33_9ACTN|nr:GAF and ANTAR domain-containing protein [Sphaerisporangium corydalis]